MKQILKCLILDIFSLDLDITWVVQLYADVFSEKDRGTSIPVHQSLEKLIVKLIGFQHFLRSVNSFQ